MLKPGSFQKTVTTAGTAEKLHASLSVKSIAIWALPGNTDVIYLGGSDVSSATGLVLPLGGVITLDSFENSPISIPDLWVDSAVNGEGVSVFYLGR